MDQTAAMPAKGQLSDRVIPLLQGLSRLEELTASMAMRLDPITVHASIASGSPDRPDSNTVTARINRLGDSLQYLLDNIEL